MTSFSRLYVGQAGGPQDTTLRQQPTVATGANPTAQVGVAISPIVAYSVVPLTLGAANIAAAQTLAAAGNLALTAGTGVTAATVKGVSVLALDCARCITFTGVSATSAANYLVIGYDDYQQPMSQLVTGPVGATTVTSTKAFRYITSVAVSAGTTGNVTMGTSDTLGLMYRSDAFEMFVGMSYNGGVITANTGFTAAVTTSPATTTTGDIRGTYALQSASNGTKRYSVYTYLPNVDTVTAVFGVQQA